MNSENPLHLPGNFEEQINTQIEAVHSRSLSSIDSIENIEQTIEGIKEGKKRWVNGDEFLKRLDLLNIDGPTVQTEVISNLAEIRVYILSEIDFNRLRELIIEYMRTQDQSLQDKVPVCSSGFLAEKNTKLPLAVRGNIYLYEDGFSDLAENLDHEISHGAIQGTLTDQLRLKKDIFPKPTPNSSPREDYPEFFMKYIGEPVEVDARVRSAIKDLKESWDPKVGPATQQQVTDLRDGRLYWHLSTLTKQLIDHYDDESLLWLLNSMPAV